MPSFTIKSPAKVNLFLKVLGRRSDGYHELVTLFHRISLHDRLILKKINWPQFRLIIRHSKLGPARKNLIYRAYQTLRQVASWKGGVEVTLEKNVPIAAGLGGGSSNAAHFLLGMNRLFDLKLSQKTLTKLGAQLGSDVPFFLSETNQAVGTGRGEKVKPIPAQGRLWFVLIVPHFRISTPLVYRKLRAAPLTRISHDVTITSVFSGHQKKGKWLTFLRNDLFQTSCSIRPELKQIGALFDQLGVTRWLMSGSGPTMFSIHKSTREAMRIARIIRRQKPSVKVFVCHTY